MSESQVLPEVRVGEEGRSHLICFQNIERPCGPDCMAYIPTPEAKEYEGQPWANCHVLVNMHRQGKYTAVTASLIEKITKASSSKLPPPPVVT